MVHLLRPCAGLLALSGVAVLAALPMPEATAQQQQPVSYKNVGTVEGMLMAANVAQSTISSIALRVLETKLTGNHAVDGRGLSSYLKPKRRAKPRAMPKLRRDQLKLSPGKLPYLGSSRGGGHSKVTFHDYDFDLTPNVVVHYFKVSQVTKGKYWAKPGDMTVGQIVDVHLVVPATVTAKKGTPIDPSQLKVNKVVIHAELDAPPPAKKK